MAISYTLAHFAKQFPSVTVFTSWSLSLNVESYIIGNVPNSSLDSMVLLYFSSAFLKPSQWFFYLVRLLAQHVFASWELSKALVSIGRLFHPPGGMLPFAGIEIWEGEMTNYLTLTFYLLSYSVRILNLVIAKERYCTK